MSDKKLKKCDEKLTKMLTTELAALKEPVVPESPAAQSPSLLKEHSNTLVKTDQPPVNIDA